MPIQERIRQNVRECYKDEITMDKNEMKEKKDSGCQG
jgi:hypothetical protein